MNPRAILAKVSTLLWGSPSEEDADRELNIVLDRIEADGRTEVMTGSIHLIGLSRVRENLGSRWEVVADRAEAIACEEIERAIGALDFFRPVPDQGYLICFDTSDKAHAEEVAARISKAIELRLLSEVVEVEGSAAVRYFVAKVGKAEVGTAPGITGSLYSALCRIRDEVEETVSRDAQALTSSGAGAIYQPVWASQDSGVTMNRGMLDASSGSVTARWLSSIHDTTEMIAALDEIDSKLLARCTADLHLALSGRKSSSLVVPVHFRSLALGNRSKTVKIGRLVPDSYRANVLIEIIGTPAAAGTRDIRNAVMAARQVADRVLLQARADDRRLTQDLVELLWGVSVNIADLDTRDAADAKALETYCRTAVGKGLHSFAFGCNTIEKAEKANKLQFGHLGGAAIQPLQVEPHPESRFKPLFAMSSGLAERDQSSRRSYPRFAPLDPNTTVTLPDGTEIPGRVLNASRSGAAVTMRGGPPEGSAIHVGSVAAKVVRSVDWGVAVQFDEVQAAETLERSMVSTMDVGAAAEKPAGFRA